MAKLQDRILKFLITLFCSLFTTIVMIFFLIYKISCLSNACWFLLALSICIIVFLFFTFPVIKLPNPTGNFFIGVIPHYFLDKDRKNLNNDFAREFFGYIWFPTDEKNDQYKKSFYVPENIFKDAKILSEFIKINASAKFNASKLSETLDCYPIIIVSHGLGSLCNFSTAQIQELVSHGYIVIGINHTDFCYISNFADGGSKLQDDDFDIPIEQFLEDTTEQLLNTFEQKIEICVKDISFVIDILEQLNSDKSSIFYKRLNLNNIGILGHSIGGAIAAEACRVDPRLKAGISLDGSITEKTAQNKFVKPFMFIVGYLLNESEDLLNRRIRKLKITKDHVRLFHRKRSYIKNLCSYIGKDGYYITLENASHFAFTDFTLVSPVLKTYLDYYLGARHDKNYAYQINNHVLLFFNKYIKENEKLKN